MDKFARPYVHLFCVAKMEEGGGGGVSNQAGGKKVGYKS